MRMCGASWSKRRGTIGTTHSLANSCAAANKTGPRKRESIGWQAQQRLYRRYQRLAARGKPKQHVVTAVARELTGFVWATLTQ